MLQAEVLSFFVASARGTTGSNVVVIIYEAAIFVVRLARAFFFAQRIQIELSFAMCKISPSCVVVGSNLGKSYVNIMV